MPRKKSPHHTDENYNRLYAIIMPMQTPDEFLEAFPESNKTVGGYSPESLDEQRLLDVLQDMQAYPNDSVWGILAHVCSLCGTVTFRRVVQPGFLAWCPSCEQKRQRLCGASEEWNGLTLKGEDTVMKIMAREFRIPALAEVEQYQRKRRPRRLSASH